MAGSSAVKSPKAKTSKSKKASSHPTYKKMAQVAIAALKDRKGSSRQAILKYIMANNNVGDNKVAINRSLGLALKNGLKSGEVKNSKGAGLSGLFKVGKVVKPKAKKVKKPKAAGSKTPTKKRKSSTAKKTPKKSAKKPKKTKKTPAKKTPVKKTPVKKTATKKKAVKKTTTSKKTSKKTPKKVSKK